MSSEEIASADSLLTENAALRARILEWEDAYDRLAGAFDLHMAICECQSALSDYAGGYYDVVLGELAAQAEKAETARKAWTELGAVAQAIARDAIEERDALWAEMEAARAVIAAARQEKAISKHIWTQPGEATSAVSDFEIALDQALAVYDRVTKANGHA